MKSLTQYIRETETPLHDDAILMPLRDFIDALQLLDAQKTDQERIVEIREDCPEPNTLAVRLVVREQEEEPDSGNALGAWASRRERRKTLTLAYASPTTFDADVAPQVAWISS